MAFPNAGCSQAASVDGIPSSIAPGCGPVTKNAPLVATTRTMAPNTIAHRPTPTRISTLLKRYGIGTSFTRRARPAPQAVHGRWPTGLPRCGENTIDDAHVTVERRAADDNAEGRDPVW